MSKLDEMGTPFILVELLRGLICCAFCKYCCFCLEVLGWASIFDSEDCCCCDRVIY